MTTNHHTAISNGAAANASSVNTPLGQLDSAITDVLDGDKEFTGFTFDKASPNPTISSGSVTVTRNYMIIDTEGAAATDTLDTLTPVVDGKIVIIQPANAARVITVGHLTGNIRLARRRNIVLNDTSQMIALKGNSATNRYEEMASDSAGMSVLASDEFSSVVSATITVPTGWETIQLEAQLRGSNASTFIGLLMRPNGDSTVGNYRAQYMLAGATSVSAAEDIGVTASLVNGGILAASAPSNMFTSLKLTIPGYTDTGKVKVARWEFSQALALTSGNIQVVRGTGIWNVTTAISSLVMSCATGNINGTYRLLGID